MPHRMCVHVAAFSKTTGRKYYINEFFGVIMTFLHMYLYSYMIVYLCVYAGGHSQQTCRRRVMIPSQLLPLLETSPVGLCTEPACPH